MDKLIILLNEKFEHIREIAGYLVGTLERFNDEKKVR